MSAQEGDMKIWHTVKLGGEMFWRRVETINQAMDLLTLLADYDNYLGDDLIPCNAQGLCVFEGGEWCEWCDDEGRDISEVLRERAEDMRRVV